MSDLANQKINFSFGSLLQVPGGLTSSLQAITDGNGVSSGLQLSTTGISGQIISDTVDITGGTIDGTTIGSVNPYPGTFSALTIGSLSGILKASAGLVTAATASVDYAPATSGTAILKGNGSGGFANAVASTDYAPATSGTSILKANGSGGFTNATSGTDYAPATSGTSILYGNGSGGFSDVTIGSGLQFVGGTLASTSGGGSVTTVSVVSANGFAGTVANASFTPAITLTTSVTGLLKGNGTAISAAASGTDYTSPTGTENLSNKTITASSLNSTPIGASSPSTGAFTTLSASGTTTLSGGTANGVLYLNGSKAVTSGSGLVFDGTNFSTTGNATAAALIPSGATVPTNGMFLPSANTVAWSTGSSERMRLTSAGYLGINTSSPGALIEVLPVNGGAAGQIRIGDYSLTAPSTVSVIESFGARYDANNSFGGRFGASYRRTDGTAIASGAQIGVYAFGGQWGTDTGYTSTNLLYAASIAGVAEGSFTSATAMPSGISFRTGSTGQALSSVNTTYGTERMRLTSAGYLGIGLTNPGVPLDVNGITRTANAYSISYPGVPGATSSFGAGTISADANWGMYFRATTGAALAEFNWANGAGTTRMTIDNAGRVGIGGTPSAGQRLLLAGNLTGATTAYGQLNYLTSQSDVTSAGIGYATNLQTAAASFALSELTHYKAIQGGLGAGSTVTNQYGFNVTSSLTGATNNYGFYSNIASGTGRWNFYAAGTAANYFAGVTNHAAAINENKTAPSISAGTLTLDCSAGNVFAVSLNASITTLSFTNVPTTGNAYALTLSFTADGTARTVTWGSSVKWPSGTAPTLTSTNAKVDTFVLTTWDGGTTWYAFTAGQNA